MRIDSLDGLRAIAILLVLLNHFTPGRNSNQGLRSLVFKVADLGWTGVDLFFVLSGFLITGILLRAKAKNLPLRNFLIRRALRIVPAYYLALVLVFFIAPATLALYPIPGASVQVPFWLYVSNFPRASYELLEGIVGMSHFWSLAVEMQFYLLWPIVIYFAGLRAILIIGVSILLVALAFRGFAAEFGAHWTVFFGWSPFRWDGLVIGSLIALAVRSNVRFRYERARPLLLATIVTCGIFAFWVIWTDRGAAMFKDNSYPMHVTLAVLIPFAMSLLYGAVLWVGLQPNWLSTVLGSSAFKRLALYSYGLYIFHYLLAESFAKTFGPQVLVKWTGGQDLPVYAYFVLASSLSFVVAMASYHLFEVHFLRLKSRFG